MLGNDLSLAAWKRVAEQLPVELHGYAREWAEAKQALTTDPTDSLARLEWELWRSLCAVLRETGTVTAEDLNARLSDTSTAGRCLLRDLRRWGDARAAIARAEVSR